MKVRFFGPIPTADLFQAIYEAHNSIYQLHGIKHVKFATLNSFPCDEYGRPVTIYDQNGLRVLGYDRRGYYKSAACAFELKCFEPKPVTLPRFDM